MVIVVRKGNPKNIKGWDDLVKPGVKISRPNPASSGSAKWNILAAYGHVLADGGSEADAAGVPDEVLRQRRGPPGQRPGRHHGLPERHRRRAAVLRERGDPGPAERRGLRLRRPRRDPADPEPGRGHHRRRAARPRSSSTYLTGKEAQTDYAEQGFRPLDDSIKVEVEGANDPSDPFPAPKTLLTIDEDFGGWAEANTKFFDEDNGIVTKIQRKRARIVMASVRSSADGSGRGAQAPSARRRRSLTAGSGLGLGVAVLWFSLLVLIPLGAGRRHRRSRTGWAGFWDTITQPQTLSAVRADRRAGRRS